MKKHIIVFCACLFFIAIPFLQGAYAASLQFDPESATIATGEEFEMSIDVDAGVDQILAVDAKITYDTNLEVVSVEDGTYLTVAKKDYATSGEIYIAGIIEDAGTYVTGAGTLATVTFRGRTNGTASMSFVCIPGETATDSNIAKNVINADDIIVCSENGTASITVGSGTSTVSTPTPTSTTRSTSTTSTTSTSRSTTSTSSTLPETGLVEDVLKYVTIPGLLLVIGGVVAKLLVL